MALDEISAMIQDDSWLRDSPPPLSEPVPEPAGRAAALKLGESHLRRTTVEGPRRSKRRRLPEFESSDEDEEASHIPTQKELQFETLVETCEQQVQADEAMIEVPKWGQRVFGLQRQAPTLDITELGNLASRVLLAAQALRSKSLLEDDSNTETLMMDLLTGDWLFPLVLKIGQCEETILQWLFHQLAYSKIVDVERAACHFLCRFLLCRNEVLQINWSPSFQSILTVLRVYGCLEVAAEANACTEEGTNEETLEGPPHNLGSLLKLLAACCKIRNMHQAFTAQEAESFVVIIAAFFLDRQLLVYSILVQECLVALVNYFTGEEWLISCERIATSISGSDREICNYVRLTRSLQSVDNRIQFLQKRVAFHLFMKTTKKLVASSDVQEVVSVFSQIDLKAKEINFVDLYYQLGLIDIWLWSNPLMWCNQSALDTWLAFLRNCSCQISSTDWRPYASKVRNWASLLLQNYESCRQPAELGIN